MGTQGVSGSENLVPARKGSIKRYRKGCFLKRLTKKDTKSDEVLVDSIFYMDMFTPLARDT